jgi:hypothetical protein
MGRRIGRRMPRRVSKRVLAAVAVFESRHVTAISQNAKK